jgi:FAD-linked sulfhydryl oxidase
MARRQHLTVTVVMVVLVLFFLTYFLSSTPSDRNPIAIAKPGAQSGKYSGKGDGAANLPDLGGISESVLTGGSIAPKLENKTAKYVDLGVLSLAVSRGY